MSQSPPGPAIPHGSTALRPHWPDLPEQLRDRVEEQLGAPVVAVSSQRSGFTQGFASRLVYGHGERAFVKAICDEVSPAVADCYRAEAQVNPYLPHAVPAPRLQWTLEVDGWVILCFDDVPGHQPARPWDAHELTQVLTTLVAMNAALSPAPSGLVVPYAHEWLREDFSAWRRFAESDADPSAVPSGRLDQLAALEARVFDAIEGTDVIHCDLRDDNVIIGDDGQVWICDWNWPCRAAPWVDLVTILISAYGDGYDADALLAAHPLGQGVHGEQIDALLAALGGYFTEASGREPIEGSPFLRTHQAWYAQATLTWLALRQGWVT